MGDVRPHHQGVKGIGFPWFPHLRPTEAREQCELCCLSVPVCFFFSPPSSVSCSLRQLQSHHFLFLVIHSVIYIYPPALSISPFSCTPAVLRFSFHCHRSPLLLISQTLSHAGGAAMLRGLLGLPAAFLRLCRSTLRSSM